jgi:hypothetical protein
MLLLVLYEMSLLPGMTKIRLSPPSDSAFVPFWQLKIGRDGGEESSLEQYKYLVNTIEKEQGLHIFLNVPIIIT